MPLTVDMSGLSKLISQFKDECINPAECARRLKEMVVAFITNRVTPDPIDALSCLLAVISGLLHQDHAPQAFGSDATLAEFHHELALLAKVCECPEAAEPSKITTTSATGETSESVGGPILDNLIAILLPRLIEMVEKMIRDWIENRKDDGPISVTG